MEVRVLLKTPQLTFLVVYISINSTSFSHQISSISARSCSSYFPVQLLSPVDPQLAENGIVV